MTSEIVIANATGVVLGADTKVTTTTARVEHESATSKIHILVDDPPIALMIYGRARFCGLPWASLVGAFRTYHHGSYGTVKQAASSFYNWLRTTNVINIEARRQESSLCVDQLAAECLSRASHMVSSGYSNSLESALTQVIIERHEDFNSIAGIGEIASGRLVQPEPPIDIPSDCGLPRRLQRRLRELPTMAQASGLGANGTGLVFAGFGVREHQPVVCHLSGLRQLSNGLNLDRGERHAVGGTTAAVILSYAHDDQICAMTRGAHRDLAADFHRLCDGLIESFDQATGPEIFTVAHQAVKALKSWWIDHASERAADMIEASAQMAPRELAHFATCMIASETLNQRVMTGVRSSVGGDIEVVALARDSGMPVKRRLVAGWSGIASR